MKPTQEMIERRQAQVRKFEDIVKHLTDNCTGYGFADGLWFRHTWVVNEAEKTILECTPNTLCPYFGIILTKEEQQQYGEILDVEEYRRG